MERMPLHPNDTPYAAYARAVRFGAYTLAAVVARDYGLGRDLMIFALHHAMVRFEELGFPEAAVAFAEQLGFTVVTATMEQLAQCAGLDASPANDRQPRDPRLVN